MAVVAGLGRTTGSACGKVPIFDVTVLASTAAPPVVVTTAVDPRRWEPPTVLTMWSASASVMKSSTTRIRGSQLATVILALPSEFIALSASWIASRSAAASRNRFSVRGGVWRARARGVSGQGGAPCVSS